MKKERFECNAPYSDKIVVKGSDLWTMHRRDLEIEGEGSEEIIKKRSEGYKKTIDIQKATK